MRNLREAVPRKVIAMVNGIPVTDYDKCTSCGVCVQKCPTHAYKLLERTLWAKRKRFRCCRGLRIRRERAAFKNRKAFERGAQCGGTFLD
jgi:Fe-S-cluster-containing hydrogenase component 2